MQARLWFELLGVLAVNLSLLGAPGPAFAQQQADTPPPFPEVNFRRVPVPGPDHVGPRINIQIAPPVPQIAVPTPEAPPSEAAPSEDIAHLDWFWSVISPDLPPTRARFWEAQELLAAAPEAASLGAPRLETLTRIAQTYGRDLLAASIDTGVSPALALSVIAVESAGRPDAISSAGAQGLMQMIPATADRFAVTDPFDPAQNITGGIAYLDWLLDEFDGDVILALAAYNAGEGAVTRNGGVPDFEETRTYVPRVLAAWMQARVLCLTPPELVSDGCVFQVMASN